jgi:hypothetical protein
MRTLINNFHEFSNYFSVHRKRKYISYSEAIKNFKTSFGKRIERYNLRTVKKFKTSDTVFLLGSGPSLNTLDEKHLDIINNCDSFGMSYSFIKKEIIPTYHQFANEEIWGFKYCTEKFLSYREKYSDTVIFMHYKQLSMLNHPRLTPMIFPQNPKYCLYKPPRPISLEANRPFRHSDFEKSLNYRNIMSLILDIAVRLEYKNIVLIGVDLDKWSFFYDQEPEMEYYINRLYKSRKDMEGRKNFDTMYPKGNKFHTFDTYLYALHDYLKQKKNINLYIAFKDNMLHPGLSAFFT